MKNIDLGLITGLFSGLMLGMALESVLIKKAIKYKANISATNDHPGFIPDAVYFTDSEDAVNALKKANQVCSDYGNISIADVYELCGADNYYEMGYYKSCKLGWTSTSLFSIEHMYGSVYALRLPAAYPVNDK